MGMDRESTNDRMEKIDVRVPASMLEAIEEEYSRRGYSSRSEAIRDALRDWLNPPVELSDEILDDLATSREKREGGKTMPHALVRGRLGLGARSSTSANNTESDTSELGPEEGEKDLSRMDKLREELEIDAKPERKRDRKDDDEE